MIESIIGFIMLWLIHVIIAAGPALLFNAFMKSRPQWKSWEFLYLILPFWILIFSQWVYPVGGMSNWIVTLGAITIILSITLVVRITIPPHLFRSRLSFLLLTIVCFLTIAIHILVPSLPD